jgi:hypothetical protein
LSRALGPDCLSEAAPAMRAARLSPPWINPAVQERKSRRAARPRRLSFLSSLDDWKSFPRSLKRFSERKRDKTKDQGHGLIQSDREMF